MDFNRTYLKDQSNKKHKGLNVKLEKRWKNEKERKIKKKTKKLERSQNTVKYHKDFKEAIKGVNFHRLKRQVDLFKEKFANEIEDLTQVAEFIDQGKKIDIKDIENSESKILIENIFDILGVKGANHVFSKGNLNFSCKDAIMMVLRKGDCPDDPSDRNDNRDDSGDSDDSKSVDRRSESSLSRNDSVKNDVIPKSDEAIKPKNVAIPVLKHPVVEKIQVNRPAMLEDKRFSEAMRTQPIDRVSAFTTQSVYQNYDKKLNNTKDQQRLYVEDDLEEKNQKMQLYFDNYDKINRPKSLLEAHREKMETKSGNKGIDSGLEPRALPMNQKSEKLFSIVNNERFSIQKNFSEAKFKNSFM